MTLIHVSVFSFAQSEKDSSPVLPKTNLKILNAEFNIKEILLLQGEIISNVLHITNNTPKKTKFRLSLDYPAGWKALFKSDRYYELNPGDSLFIPVRVMPTIQILGSTRFMISAYLMSEDDIQLANTFFWSFTQKRTSWTLNIEPSTKRYFKNGTNVTDFKVNILNTGTESQPVSLSILNTSLYAILSDSNDRTLKNPTYNFNLKPFDDTTFSFNFKYFQGTRNFNRMDIENHKPDNPNLEKSFSIYVNSSEPNLGGGNGFQAGQKVTFTRLSNDKKVNDYQSASLPMVVDLNVNNIMNDVTFTSLNIRGVGQLAQNQTLIYNLQTTTSTNTTDNILANSMYYLGYYYSLGSVQGGYINGGMMGIQSFGRGLKSDYFVTRNQKIGAFYINNNGIPGSNNAYAYGLNYELKYYKQNSLMLEYGRSENSYTKTITDAYNAKTGFNIYKSHTIYLNYSTTVTSFTGINSSKIGYFGSFSYNGNFLKNKISTNQSFGSSTKEYSNSNIARIYYNQSTRFSINNRTSLVLVNGYNKIDYTLNSVVSNHTQNNQLSLNISEKNTSYQPQLFYNIYQYTAYSYQSRGAGFSYNIFNPKDNARVSTNIQAGYNKTANTVNPEDKFFIQWSGFVFYHTLTLTGRYIMMPTASPGSSVSVFGENKTQQTFASSIQHEYLFSNTHFVLQTGLNYYYNNIFNQSSASIYPEFYYFTNTGWRFKVNMNYNIISGNVYNFNNQQLNTDNPTTYVNQNVYIGFGLRKEFGIPVPFVKKKNHDIDFMAFYDLNGNGKKDKNEMPVENIVISVDNEEVITNEDGEAHMRNYPSGIWPILARSLEANETWFANISDSVIINKTRTVMVPFVRGVKIKGKVSIDRESIRSDASSPFDLSRIKVTANADKSFSTLTDFDGNFEFYLPYGKYVITMDENILGEKYKVAKNNYEIEANRSVDGMFISYLIVEKKRKINKKSFSTPDIGK